MAIAGPMLQRNAPDPTALARRRTRVRSEILRAFAGHRPGAIAGQPGTPVLPGNLQPVAQQQRTKAAAIDEEITGDSLPGLQCQRFDVTAAAFKRDVDHPALDACDPAGRGPAAQEIRIQAGVEMIGVSIKGREHGARAREVERIAAAGAHGNRELFERRRIQSLLPRAPPEVLELHAAPELAERSEWMYVVLARPVPIPKF